MATVALVVAFAAGGSSVAAQGGKDGRGRDGGSGGRSPVAEEGRGSSGPSVNFSGTWTLEGVERAGHLTPPPAGVKLGFLGRDIAIDQRGTMFAVKNPASGGTAATFNLNGSPSRINNIGDGHAVHIARVARPNTNTVAITSTVDGQPATKEEQLFTIVGERLTVETKDADGAAPIKLIYRKK